MIDLVFHNRSTAQCSISIDTQGRVVVPRSDRGLSRTDADGLFDGDATPSVPGASVSRMRNRVGAAGDNDGVTIHHIGRDARTSEEGRGGCGDGGQNAPKVLLRGATWLRGRMWICLCIALVHFCEKAYQRRRIQN